MINTFPGVFDMNPQHPADFPITEKPASDRCKIHSACCSSTERKIGNTVYVITTNCDGGESLSSKMKRLIFSCGKEIAG